MSDAAEEQAEVVNGRDAASSATRPAHLSPAASSAEQRVDLSSDLENSDLSDEESEEECIETSVDKWLRNSSVEFAAYPEKLSQKPSQKRRNGRSRARFAKSEWKRNPIIKRWRILVLLCCA